MRQKSLTAILFTIGLTLLTVGCQAPEQFDSLRAIDASTTGSLRSSFIPPRKSIPAKVSQPILIESIHVSENSQLATLMVSVNGQLVAGEQTSGLATFPEGLATIGFLERGRPVREDYSVLEASSPICRTLLRAGGLVQANLREPEFPSSTWTVCQIWIGHTPGTYDLSLTVTNREGNKSQPIVQRIEVQ